MNSKHSFVIFIATLILFIPITSENIFADHGSGGGGGGCSGDCSPPTLGIDNSGTEHIEGGFSINDASFDVTNFKQEITTQMIKANDPVEITLKIYENSGTHNLAHVALYFGNEEKTISGVKVYSHHATIVWEKTFDGNTSIDVDDNDLISNVDVIHNLIEDASGNENKATQLTFKFTPTKIFDPNPLLVEMWDHDRNSWTNYFYNSLQIEAADVYEITTLEAEVPNWFKTNAGFWAKNQIPDKAFANGIIFLIENEIMYIPNLQKYEAEPLLHFIDLEKGAQYYIDRYYNDEVYKEWFDENFPEYTIEEAVGMPSDLVIPDWVKINAERWSNGFISDTEFVNGIKFLIENGIILL